MYHIASAVSESSPIYVALHFGYFSIRTSRKADKGFTKISRSNIICKMMHQSLVGIIAEAGSKDIPSFSPTK